MHATLQKQLQSCSLSISYLPLSDEIDPCSIPDLPQTHHALQAPQNKDTSPNAFANELLSKYPGENGFLLIPGTHFDRWGTRHGRGGGWYDRLLAELPKDWVRIGVAKGEQISYEPLKRNPWDEPMDWLIYRQNGEWFIEQLPKRKK